MKITIVCETGREGTNIYWQKERNEEGERGKRERGKKRETTKKEKETGKDKIRPWWDSNPQSPAPEADALSIRPQGQALDPC